MLNYSMYGCKYAVYKLYGMINGYYRYVGVTIGEYAKTMSEKADRAHELREVR